MLVRPGYVPCLAICQTAATSVRGRRDELSKIVEAYVEALQVSEFEQRLKALEERADAAYATF
jgi:hypothetical protein